MPKESRAKSRARVRVQEGPHGRELIVDETFASFYQPGSAVTGSVWDAIAAPILALAPERRERILLLGLGGGSVARIARALAPKARIVGVELDPDVVRLARAHFELDSLGIELVVGDAREFLVRDRKLYDCVLEDVFIGHGDAVRKPDWIPEPGHALAARRLRDGGILVSNTLDEMSAVARSLRARFAARVCIDIEGYDNRILVGGEAGLSGRGLRAAVARDPTLSGSLDVLSFRSL